jgi:hypothetical protein
MSRGNEAVSQLNEEMTSLYAVRSFNATNSFCKFLRFAGLSKLTMTYLYLQDLSETCVTYQDL